MTGTKRKTELVIVKSDSKSKSRRFGYARTGVSASSNDALPKGLGYDKIYEDFGSINEADRPALAALMNDIREGDIVLVPSMHQLAGNMVELGRLLKKITEFGVQVEFVNEDLLFAGGKSKSQNLLMAALDAFTNFEQSVINERRREGIEAARSKGVYKGRKKSLAQEQISAALSMISDGQSKSEVAKTLGVSRATLYAYLESATQEEQNKAAA